MQALRPELVSLPPLESTMWELLGNSMASCVVQRILIRFLRLLRPSQRFEDPWETGDAQHRLAVVAVPDAAPQPALLAVPEAAELRSEVSEEEEAVEDTDSEDAADAALGNLPPRAEAFTPAALVWQTVPTRVVRDTCGQGRIPAFWYT